MWDGLGSGILVGITTTFIPINIVMVLLGCFVGSFIGMLPGLGPITAVALMIPVTYGLDPSTGMVLLAGVYYGAIFGGSTCSILINAPGEAATVATAFDGYPMAQQGKPGKALAIAAYSSFSGGTIAVVLLMLGAPMMANVAKSFQSSDYFALMVMGLTAVSAFAGRGGFLKALLMTVVGLMLATVGTDQTSGVQRFTFGSMDLLDGLSFVMLAMATFAITEGLIMVLKRQDTTGVFKAENLAGISDLKVTKEEFKKSAPPSLAVPCWDFSSVLCLVRALPWAHFYLTVWSATWPNRPTANSSVRAVSSVWQLLKPGTMPPVPAPLFPF